MDLPASKDVLANSYRGYNTSKNRETYYPKMYTVQAYDLVNQLICDFRFSSVLQENVTAQEMVQGFERNSVSIYDRLYSGYNTFLSHMEAKNHFIVRARTTGAGVNKAVAAFLKSQKTEENIIWEPCLKYKGPDIHLRLVKVKNSRSNENIIFITNLSSKQFTKEEIGSLYQRRWGIETSFKDLTNTLKLNQFHSKSLNGILQEVFALLWFVNNIKTKTTWIDKGKKDWLQRKYKKSNFKLCCEIVIENLVLLVQKKFKKLDRLILYWMNRTSEYRVHLSRTYPRAVRLRGRAYALLNVVPRRQTERH